MQFNYYYETRIVNLEWVSHIVKAAYTFTFGEWQTWLHLTVLLIRAKTYEPGPILPDPIIFPCTINIDDQLIFIFGQRVSQNLNKDKSLAAYIYNQRSEKWTNLTGDFPCPIPFGIDKYTCAILRPIQYIIMVVGNCNPILNLSLYPESWTWTSMSAPTENGIVFNIDKGEENIMFIGNNGTSSNSEVYVVSEINTHIMQCKKY